MEPSWVLTAHDFMAVAHCDRQSQPTGQFATGQLNTVVASFISAASTEVLGSQMILSVHIQRAVSHVCVHSAHAFTTV